MPNRNWIVWFRIEFNLHLIGQKMNHRAGILRIITRNQIQPRAQINEELAKSIFFFFLTIEFNLHLIGEEMKHQAGILRIITKNQIQQRSKIRISRSNLVENRNSI